MRLTVDYTLWFCHLWKIWHDPVKEVLRNHQTLLCTAVPLSWKMCFWVMLDFMVYWLLRLETVCSTAVHCGCYVVRSTVRLGSHGSVRSCWYAIQIHATSHRSSSLLQSSLRRLNLPLAAHQEDRAHWMHFWLTTLRRCFWVVTTWWWLPALRVQQSLWMHGAPQLALRLWEVLVYPVHCCRYLIHVQHFQILCYILGFWRKISLCSNCWPKKMVHFWHPLASYGILTGVFHGLLRSLCQCRLQYVPHLIIHNCNIWYN